MTGSDPGLTPDAAPANGAANEPVLDAETASAGAAAAGEGAPADELAALRAALDAAQAKANENFESFLRARAETDNARRRAQEEVAKAHKFAIESFAEALVPVADSLEKALATDADAASLRAGVEITLRQLRAAFEKNRLAEIDPQGERFDPHRHQAIATVPPPADGSVAPNHVVQVLQKGWSIADRVLRPALVTVAQREGA